MFNDFYEYEVYSIKFDGAITVDYKYSPLNGKERRQKAKTTERPHDDWIKAWYNMKELFADLWGMPLVDAVTGAKLEWNIRSVKFLFKEKTGSGVKITASAEGVENIEDEIILTTQSFWEMAPKVFCGVRMQELTTEQLAKVTQLKKETFEFIHMGKKQQPTLEEAAQFIEGGAAE